MQLIPAFLHIPKCGADYFLSKSWSIFIDFLIGGLSYQKANALIGAHRLIITNDAGLPILTALVYDPSGICKSEKACYRRHENPNNPFVSYISYADFLKEIKISTLKLFSVIVEPDGINLIDKDFFKDLESNNGIKFKYIATLQEPVKMVESFFISILKRSKETGETYSKSLSSYIKSRNAPYGWLIRKINGDDSKIISKKAKLKAIEVLNKIEILDLKEIDILISNTYKECHNINQNNLHIKYSEEKINVKKYNLNIDDNTRLFFEKKSKFDLEIYKRFILEKKAGRKNAV